MFVSLYPITLFYNCLALLLVLFAFNSYLVPDVINSPRNLFYQISTHLRHLIKNDLGNSFLLQFQYLLILNFEIWKIFGISCVSVLRSQMSPHVMYGSACAILLEVSMGIVSHILLFCIGCTAIHNAYLLVP